MLPAMDALAYCAKCRQKVAISGPQEITLANGSRQIAGTCSTCGTNVRLFLSSKQRAGGAARAGGPMADKCPGCETRDFRLKDAEDENKTLQSQFTQLQSQLHQVNDELGKRHATIQEHLACPNCGPKALEDLPKLLSKDQAKRITEAHFPGAFKPIKV